MADDCGDVTNDYGNTIDSPCGMWTLFCNIEDYKSWYRLGRGFLTELHAAKGYLEAQAWADDETEQHNVLASKIFLFRKQFFVDHLNPEDTGAMDTMLLWTNPKPRILELKSDVGAADCLLAEVNEFVDNYGSTEQKQQVFEVEEEKVNRLARDKAEGIGTWGWVAIGGASLLVLTGVIGIAWYATSNKSDG